MRRIVMRSRARATGKYPSWKAGRMVQWESINELNAFRILDAMPEVSTFTERVLTMDHAKPLSSNTSFLPIYG